MSAILKYPRTPHVEGSRLQPGDRDLSATPFTALCGRHLVVEEKIDGANAAVDSGTHWLNRPIIENQLADGVDIFR